MPKTLQGKIYTPVNSKLTPLLISDIAVTNKEVKSGEETTLTCSVSGVTAVVTFAWTGLSESSNVAYSEDDDTQSSLLVVTPNIDTTYSCTVTDANSVAAAAVIVTLNVFSKYFVTSNPLFAVHADTKQK